MPGEGGGRGGGGLRTIVIIISDTSRSHVTHSENTFLDSCVKTSFQFVNGQQGMTLGPVTLVCVAGGNLIDDGRCDASASGGDEELDAGGRANVRRELGLGKLGLGKLEDCDSGAFEWWVQRSPTQHSSMLRRKLLCPANCIAGWRWVDHACFDASRRKKSPRCKDSLRNIR
jgi:hypothetical protein